MIGQDDSASGVYHQHSLDHSVNDGLQELFLGRCFVRSQAQLLGNPVDRRRDLTDCISRASRKALIEFAFGNGCRHPAHFVDGSQHYCREHIGEPHRGDEAGASRDDQRGS